MFKNTVTQKLSYSYLTSYVENLGLDRNIYDLNTYKNKISFHGIEFIF